MPWASLSTPWKSISPEIVTRRTSLPVSESAASDGSRSATPSFLRDGDARDRVADFDLLDHVLALGHAAEDRVPPVELRLRGERDVELAPGRVRRRSLRHRERTIDVLETARLVRDRVAG